MSSERGRLLVAAPTLRDPNFRRTVVWMADHSDGGALGIVLNRSGDLVAADVVPDVLTGALEPGAVVWLGGPVRTDGVVVVAQWEDGGIGLLGAAGRETVDDAVRARAYAGLAGWGPGQLDAELTREDWIVVDAEDDDVFCADPETLWATVLARQGGRLALLARMPDDPSVN